MPIKRYAKRRNKKKQIKKLPMSRLPLDIHRFRLVLRTFMVTEANGLVQCSVRPYTLSGHYVPAPGANGESLSEISNITQLFDSYRPLGVTITYTPTQSQMDNGTGFSNNVPIYSVLDYDNSGTIAGTSIVTRTKVKKRELNKQWKLKYRVAAQYQPNSSTFREGFLNLQNEAGSQVGLIAMSSANPIMQAGTTPLIPVPTGTVVGELMIESYYVFRGRQ